MTLTFFIQRLQKFFFSFVTFLRYIFWNIFCMCGFNRPYYGSCPSVRPSVRLSRCALTRKPKIGVNDPTGKS